MKTLYLAIIALILADGIFSFLVLRTGNWVEIQPVTAWILNNMGLERGLLFAKGTQTVLISLIFF